MAKLNKNNICYKLIKLKNLTSQLKVLSLKCKFKKVKRFQFLTLILSYFVKLLANYLKAFFLNLP
jgi:hypothetical protein